MALASDMGRAQKREASGSRSHRRPLRANRLAVGPAIPSSGGLPQSRGPFRRACRSAFRSERALGRMERNALLPELPAAIDAGGEFEDLESGERVTQFGVVDAKLVA
jgi:hypothetical protein